MTETTDPVKLAQIEGALNLLTERIGHVTGQNRQMVEAVRELGNKFDTWRSAHEDDNAVVESDLLALRTSHCVSDLSTRRTMQVCTGLLGVIVSMFCWFINDKIEYMREANTRITLQHETDMATIIHRVEMVEVNVRSNTGRLDKMGAPPGTLP